MLYKPETNTALEYLRNTTCKNKEVISTKLAKQIETAESMLNNQCEIASHLMGIFPFGFSTRVNKGIGITELLLSSFHKNILSMYSALTLTMEGLYGTARPLLRNAYEWLMVAKFCNVSDDIKVLTNWYNQETVYFSNGVLKKIENPDPEIFKQFWTMLSQFTHATKSAIQGTLDVDEEENFLHVTNNLILISALLECNYHLLNTHLFSREIEYLVRKYKTEPNGQKSISELRKHAHILFKSNKLSYGKSTSSFVSSYKKKWQLQN